MKVWIPGALGMLGRHFVALLTQQTVDFVATGIDEIDITDKIKVSDFIKSNNITHIINCAAYTNVDLAEKEKELAFLVNSKGPQTLGQVAQKQKIKVLHFSTDYVFDGLATSPYKEEHPCSPINVYGQSKWEGEKRLLEEMPDACIIRTSWLNGFPGKNFIETMLRLMQEKETLRIVEDQIGSPTFCHDLSEAAYSLLDKSGIYHFSNSNQTNWYEFAKEIQRLGIEIDLPLKVKIIEPIKAKDYPTPAKRPSYSCLDTSKIESVLNRSLKSWQDGLKYYFMMHKNKKVSA